MVSLPTICNAAGCKNSGGCGEMAAVANLKKPLEQEAVIWVSLVVVVRLEMPLRHLTMIQISVVRVVILTASFRSGSGRYCFFFSGPSFRPL